jgi:hypothetical protein
MADLEKILGGGNKTMPVKGTGRVSIAQLLFKARTDAHLTHLKQADKTLARHKAMSMFYKGIVDLVDGYIESSMGIVPGFSIDTVPASAVIADPVAYFKDLYNQIENSRTDIKESFLQNQVDTVQELIANTLYKLQFISE